MIARLLRDNWKWTLALGVALTLVVFALAGAVLGGSNDDDTSTPSRVMVRPYDARMSQAEMRSRLETLQNRQPLDPVRQTEDTIESHRARVEADPDNPESPALLLAMGNLYRKLYDYEEAIYWYQQIFVRYPEWDGMPMVYSQLALTYEDAGDLENMLRIYMEMMDVFPEDSGPYEVARDRLGL